MGKSQRRKGYRGENQLVNYFKQYNLTVKRIPLSGATDYKKGDIELEGYTGEVKLRKDGFKEIYKWLENADILFLKADRKEYLAVVRVDLLKDLLITIKYLKQSLINEKR
jgi:Holliday junction resolvase